MNAYNNNNNFISVPYSDLHHTKNRYKYGESMPPTPGTDKAGKCPAVAGGGGGLGTGGID